MKTGKRESGGAGKRRSGAADDQEQRSVGQLIDRLAELSWKPWGPRKDYGEDFHVQIWDGGESTGLSFYVQLKSVRDAEQRKGQRTPDTLKYRLDAKDLRHWEKQTQLVVLVIWDVEMRRGYWETVPRILEALEKKGKGWRKKETVTVEVPAAHGTDAEGMRRLRWAVADHSLALVAGRVRDEEMTGTIRFTDKVTYEAFREALDRGNEVTFEGLGVPQIQMPEWHRRMYGDRPPATRVRITPTTRVVSLNVRVEVRARNVTASIPGIELKPTKQGRKHLTLTNEHQGRTITFIAVGNEDADGSFTFRMSRFGKTIQEAREAAAFFFAANQPGSRLRVVDERTGQTILDQPLPSLPADPVAEGLHDTLEKLAFLEPYIKGIDSIHLDQGITHDEMMRIAVLYEACRNGRVQMRKRLSFMVSPDADALPDRANPDVVQHLDGCKMNLLGVEIPLGRVKEVVQEPDRVVTAVRDALARARATGKPVPLHIDDVSLVAEFLDWPPPHDRLYDIASAQSGYFTLAQALEAGFTSADQLQIEERVESYGGGNVFRLVQFPPTNEHEDLVVTWLLTDKKAVFSHDTALALHELSDILPARQHITLPPGYQMPEGVELGPQVAIYHGTVDPSEITWMGPVPFTKPYRTLLDCIEDHLSPDLLDQALAQARTRGMISRAEAQALQAVRAKSA
ncbi:DUF4365 domain-containing protein [Polyangium jinanense]|uniref:DUF4365 domain-containing protein n=1 Tax=Polyangium jinanense TaxID=2829994 RepID=A0A9X3XBU4_9BACT|nr:DUF4365 domain-containing protein [Polyangium jinanense]MDC3961172.1 DUF4365 domain-containing protein [Polyangium jinanense]MDC3986475.1 DUF4365 domain-containing protein [Polyangium jinanense]